jgi:hypothetical protein
MKMTDFRDVVSCGLVEVYRRFRGTYCLHYQGNDPVMMAAVNSCETSVRFCSTTRHNICNKVVSSVWPTHYEVPAYGVLNITDSNFYY